MQTCGVEALARNAHSSPKIELGAYSGHQVYSRLLPRLRTHSTRLSAVTRPSMMSSASCAHGGAHMCAHARRAVSVCAGGWDSKRHLGPQRLNVLIEEQERSGGTRVHLRSLYERGLGIPRAQRLRLALRRRAALLRSAPARALRQALERLVLLVRRRVAGRRRGLALFLALLFVRMHAGLASRGTLCAG